MLFPGRVYDNALRPIHVCRAAGSSNFGRQPHCAVRAMQYHYHYKTYGNASFLLPSPLHWIARVSTIHPSAFGTSAITPPPPPPAQINTSSCSSSRRRSIPRLGEAQPTLGSLIGLLPLRWSITMALGMPDELLPVVVPIAVYWITSGIYYLGLRRSVQEKHRLFTQDEEDTQNLATKRQVLAGVLVNQAMQMALVALASVKLQGDAAGAAKPPPTLLRQVWQLAVATLIIDAWEYFWHRWTHESKFLYKHVHAMHHRMVVPYAFGAQYIHPLDAFFGNIIDGVVATTITGMSPRTSTLLFSLMVVKSIDDHCALWFPNHPFHRFLTNNSAFHAIHHQHYGIKYNYSGYYLATWDKLLGTAMPFTIEERKGGGYHIRTARD